MSPGVSVVICCHNSATRLPETLRHLALQQVPEGLAWEVIVVDNASTDETAERAARLCPADLSFPWRVVEEKQLGLRHARIRGVREAKHEIISFLDDDNWAPSHWVAWVSALFTRHPEIGAAGARIEPVCETAPPVWFESVRPYYAAARQHSASGDITNAPGTLLYGAGLNVRTSALRELLEKDFVFLTSGREGGRVLSGEDTELCFALRAMGWRLWYDDEMVLRHFIPRERLEWNYVRRLLFGLGQASVFLDMYLMALDQPPFQFYPAWKRSFFFQFLKVLRQALIIFLTHPVECLSKREGSAASLQFGKACGQLDHLWKLKSDYSSLRERISQARWACLV